MQIKVTVFVTSHCPGCQSLKQWLVSKKVDFATVNLDDDQALQAQILADTGQLQAPTTRLDYPDGRYDFFVGPQYDRIGRALGL